MKNTLHTAFSRRQIVGSYHFGDPKKRFTFDVYFDLDQLDRLAMKVAKNKSHKGKSGPIHIEVRWIEPV